MKKSAVVTIAVIAAITVGIVIAKYNGIVEKDVAVQKAWAPLLIKVKERYSPIPRMITDISFYATQKPPLAQALESNRDEVQKANTMSKQIDLCNKIETDLAKLLQWVKERYPGIINRHPVSVMAENLANTQAVMGPEMQAFNTAAADYNTYAQRFPNNLVAKLLGYPLTYSFFQPRN